MSNMQLFVEKIKKENSYLFTKNVKYSLVPVFHLKLLLCELKHFGKCLLIIP